MALQPFVGPWPFFSLVILYTVGRTPSVGDQLVARPVPIHWTPMPCMTFEPSTPAFERAKRVHASDREATVIGVNIRKAQYKRQCEQGHGPSGNRKLMRASAKCSLLRLVDVGQCDCRVRGAVTEHKSHYFRGLPSSCVIAPWGLASLSSVISQIRLRDACALWIRYAFYYHLHHGLNSCSVLGRTRNVTPFCRKDVLGLLWHSVLLT
jgi:hypothetical protein